jgi:hypothetical protein
MIELSQEEARQILSGLDLAAYQLQDLAKKIDIHGSDLSEVRRAIAQAHQAIALLNASKSRQELAISELPAYLKKVDLLYDAFDRSQKKMEGIVVQAWGGFACAMLIAISSIVINYRPPQPEKKAAGVRYDLIAAKQYKNDEKYQGGFGLDFRDNQKRCS